MTLDGASLIALAAATVAAAALAAALLARHGAARRRAGEGVAGDLAQLAAALRSLMLKGAQARRAPVAAAGDPADLAWEKATLRAFLLSPTGLALHGLIAARARAARTGRGDGGDWPDFLPTLLDLLEERDAYRAGRAAARLERLVGELGPGDLGRLAAGVGDPLAVVRGLLSEREHDPLLGAVVAGQENGQPAEDVFGEFVLTLVPRAADDPDVKLWVGVVRDDVAMVAEARREGANLNVTSGDLIRRYRAAFDAFVRARRTAGA